MDGLFSGLTPQQVMDTEQQNKQALNLKLAQSADPLTGTMFRGYQAADALRTNIADVFGNPIQESAAVQTAKEQEGLRTEISKMMQEGIAAGENRAITAKKIQDFLLSKGKLNEAEQVRTQTIAESQKAAESTSKIGLQEAQTTEALAKAKREKIPTYSADYEAIAKTYGKTFSELDPVTAASVVEKVNNLKIQQAQAGVANTVATDVVKANVDMLNKVQQKIVDNSSYIQSIDDARSKTSAPMITGTAADKRLAIAKYFTDLGLGGELNKEKIANTEAFAAAQTDLLLKKIGGSLGVGISNEDRKTIEKMMGSIEQNPESLNAIFDYLKKIAVRQENNLLKQQDNFAKAINTRQPVMISPTDLRGETPTITPSAPVTSTLTPRNKAFLSNPNNAAGFNEYLKKQGIALPPVPVTK